MQLDEINDQIEQGDILGMGQKDGRKTFVKAANDMNLAHRNKKLRDQEDQ